MVRRTAHDPRRGNPSRRVRGGNPGETRGFFLYLVGPLGPGVLWVLQVRSWVRQVRGSSGPVLGPSGPWVLWSGPGSVRPHRPAALPLVVHEIQSPSSPFTLRTTKLSPRRVTKEHDRAVAHLIGSLMGPSACTCRRESPRRFVVFVATRLSRASWSNLCLVGERCGSVIPSSALPRKTTVGLVRCADARRGATSAQARHRA